MTRWLLLCLSLSLGLGLLLSACATPPEPPRATLWGPATRAGRAPQAEAPALAVDDATGWQMLVWTGSGEGRPRLFARHATAGTVHMLALDVIAPFGVTLYPAQDAHFHLLWLDTPAPDEPPALFAALINAEGIAIQAPTRLSSAPVYHYTAALDAQQALRVVWSAGLLAEPGLWTRRIDGRGRVGFPVDLAAAGDYPALLPAADGLRLYWLAGRAQVSHSRLTGDTLSEAAPLTDSVALNPGDWLESFQAAADGTHGYLLWQITRMDGSAETWLSSGERTRRAWPPPLRLFIPPTAPGSLETGFNSGAVEITIPLPGAAPQMVRRAALLPGEFTAVPVAISSGDSLGVAYLRRGGVAGYQRLTTTAGLLAAPGIASDRDNHLYVTWSEPGLGAEALSDLWWTGTRR